MHGPAASTCRHGGRPAQVASGKSAAQILENTLDFAGELTRRHAECFSDSVLPALGREGIEILRWKELEQSEQEQLQKLFRERIYPVLTPLVVDPDTTYFTLGPELPAATFVRGERVPL